METTFNAEDAEHAEKTRIVKSGPVPKAGRRDGSLRSMPVYATYGPG